MQATADVAQALIFGVSIEDELDARVQRLFEYVQERGVVLNDENSLMFQSSLAIIEDLKSSLGSKAQLSHDLTEKLATLHAIAEQI